MVPARAARLARLLAGAAFTYTFAQWEWSAKHEAAFRDARRERAVDALRPPRERAGRLAEPPGAGDLDLRRGRHRRHPGPHRRRASVDRLQAAVLRRGARRRRRPDRHQGDRRLARPLHHRHRQHLASRAASDEPGRPRLRSEEGPRQHRVRRGLAGVALGQSEERHQDSQGLRRARQEGAAELFVVRARQHGPSGGAEFHHHVRHQGRARALQGRLARRWPIWSAATSSGRRRP